MTMNINELKSEKQLLEKNIKLLIAEFINKTELSVYSVNVDMVECGTIKGSNYLVNKVSVMVDL